MTDEGCLENCKYFKQDFQKLVAMKIGHLKSPHHALGHMSLVVRKPVFGVSDLVRHKPGCAVTEDC